MNIYLNRVTPIKVFFFGVLIFFIVYILSPLKVLVEIEPLSLVFFVLSYFSLLAGIVVPFLLSEKFYLHKDQLFFLNESKLKKILIFLLALVVLGFLMRYADKFFIRGYLSFDTAVERRDNKIDSSLLGVLSSPLYIISLFLPIFCFFIRKWIFVKSIVWVFFIIPAAEVVFFGSRGLVITTVGIFILYMAVFIKRPFRPVFAFPLLLFSLSLFLLSGFLFEQRISAYGMDPLYSAFNSGYAFTLVPNDYAADYIKSGAWWSKLYFYWVNFSQYYIHGLYEFSYLFTNFDGYEYRYGIYTFNILGKLIGIDIVALSFEATPRYGVYTTFVGPLFVDFGYLVFLVLFLLGLLYSFVFIRIVKGNLLLIPAYAYISVIVVFFPVVNLVQNALGFYIVSGLFVFYFLSFFISKVRLK